jgi:mRNA-degrading endonuclease RelE of RelBE toxin-antitoxin system
LLKLTLVIQERIAEHIGMLANNLDDPALDIKKLTNDPEAKLRLRVGSYRVKFNRDNGIRIDEIVRVGHRKEIYK